MSQHEDDANCGCLKERLLIERLDDEVESLKARLAECEDGQEPPTDPPPVYEVIGHAEGAVGGVDGEAIVVTTHNPFGPGSFGDAAASNSTRSIIIPPDLAADGPILTDRTIDVTAPNCTIEANGLAIRNDGSLTRAAFQVRSPEVIVRNLRCRPGPAEVESIGITGITITGENTHHVVLDRCSMAIAVDKALTISGGANRITVVDSILIWTLWNSNHKKGPHSRGITISSQEGRAITQKVSMLRCLIAGHRLRDPNVVTAEAEIINCLIVCDDEMELVTNVGDKWPGQHGTRLDLVNNYYRVNVPSGTGIVSIPNDQSPDDALVHVSGNYSNVQMFSDRYGGSKSDIPVAASSYAPMPADRVYGFVMLNAGAKDVDGQLDEIDRDMMARIADGDVIIIDEEGDLDL